MGTLTPSPPPPPPPPCLHPCLHPCLPPCLHPWQESGEDFVDFGFGLADTPRAAAVCARSRLLVEAAVGGGPAVLRLSVALWPVEPGEPMPHLPHVLPHTLPHVLLATVDVDVAKLASLIEGG